MLISAALACGQHLSVDIVQDRFTITISDWRIHATNNKKLENKITNIVKQRTEGLHLQDCIYSNL